MLILKQGQLVQLKAQSRCNTLKTLPCNKDYCSGFGVRLSCHNHYRSDFCTCCKHYLSDFGVLQDIIDFNSSNTYPIGFSFTFSRVTAKYSIGIVTIIITIMLYVG